MHCNQVKRCVNCGVSINFDNLNDRRDWLARNQFHACILTCLTFVSTRQHEFWTSELIMFKSCQLFTSLSLSLSVYIFLGCFKSTYETNPIEITSNHMTMITYMSLISLCPLMIFPVSWTRLAEQSKGSTCANRWSVISVDDGMWASCIP